MNQIVVALGGNALGSTPEEQKLCAARAARSLADLVEAGNAVAVCHGNGPQVGMIQLAMTAAAGAGTIAADMPLPECGAMSQGYIGYHLQNAFSDELRRRGIDRAVATVLTNVLVDEGDAAFQTPTKPIGYFYSKKQADRIAAERCCSFMEDAGRGYRQVVASPRPVDIAEKSVIRSLIRSGVITIAAGGGGIPVVRRAGRTEGVTAVVDKDFAAAKLAELVQADTLMLLTAVDAVSINYGKAEQTRLTRVTAQQMRAYAAQGQFAPGSMLPKVEASIAFLEKNPAGTAIIAALEQAQEALAGRSGTTIVREQSPECQRSSNIEEESHEDHH